MITDIKSPSDPMLPPAANQLWVGDSWTTGLGSPPTFVYKLQCVKDDETYDLNYLNVSMTVTQWAKWPADADDEKYILDALCANLGLVRA